MTQVTQTIPAGYKQTEIGVIPADWVLEKLGELVDYKNGKSFEKFIVENGKYKLITLNSLDINGKIKKEHLQVNIYDGSLRKDDLIMILSDVAHGNFLGLTDLIPENDKYVLNQRVGALKNVKKVKPYFLSKYINYHQKYFKTTGQGSSQLNLSKGDIINFSVAFPTDPVEQTAIATALSDTDALIEKLEKLIAKKKAIKQGAMQQLLTGKKRLPRFSGEWEMKKLGEVCYIRKGQLITENTRIDGNIPVIAGGKTPAYFHNKANRHGKTITISGSGASAGYIAFHKYPIFASDCSTIEESRSYSIEYIYFLLQSLQDTIYKMQTGGAQPHIHPNDLNPIIVSIPKPEEQTAIATVLSDMDTEIEKLENKLGKYRQIKTGMMQQLLTGKIRLLRK